MVSSRNKGSKFLKKPWCSVDGRVWQGNLCLSNLELSPFVRAIESLWRARNLNSLRWPVFVINSVWLPRRGECPTLLRQAGGLHFYWISGTQESGDYYRRGGVGGGWVNLPDPHIRFCNIILAFKLQFIFPFANLVIPPPPYKNSPSLGDRRADWSLK